MPNRSANCLASGPADAVREITVRTDTGKILRLFTNDLDSSADDIAALYKRGNDPIDVLKWREIFDYLEEATDRCDDVANLIEGIVLEYA